MALNTMKLLFIILPVKKPWTYTHTSIYCAASNTIDIEFEKWITKKKISLRNQSIESFFWLINRIPCRTS